MSKLLEIGFPPVLPGYERKWTKCRTCGNVAYYDYVPHSFSNPIMILPCGHTGIGRFYEAAEAINPDEAIAAIAKAKETTP